MKLAIIVPALVVGFVAPPMPVIDVNNPGSGVFCDADHSSCWIERGACAENRPYSTAQMTDECG